MIPTENLLPTSDAPQAASAPHAPPPPLQMGKLKASMTIVSESWELLKKDKEIMWFPVLSAITSIVALTILAGVMYFVVLSGNINNIAQVQGDGLSPFGYFILFVYYLVMIFIVNFFESGIYIIAHARFNGQDLNFNDGIRGATENITKIFIWSLISATVGVVLQIIADRSRFIGKIVVWMLGAAWGILTFFSLPSLIIGKKSVQDSFKDSAATIRKTWGETIIVNLGVGLFFTMITFVLFAIMLVVFVLIPDIFVGIGLLALFLISIICITIISSALSSIFKLALYEYATSGKIPEGFSPNIIQNAIKVKQ